ncbi:MAG: hypothetical protein JNK60_04130 [Acidobacteria bacterium]|nr:hypothetical protein [Acidobacteriota bacterium]
MDRTKLASLLAFGILLLGTFLVATVDAQANFLARHGTSLNPPAASNPTAAGVRVPRPPV